MTHFSLSFAITRLERCGRSWHSDIARDELAAEKPMKPMHVQLQEHVHSRRNSQQQVMQDESIFSATRSSMCAPIPATLPFKTHWVMVPALLRDFWQTAPRGHCRQL